MSEPARASADRPPLPEFERFHALGRETFFPDERDEWAAVAATFPSPLPDFERLHALGRSVSRRAAASPDEVEELAAIAAATFQATAPAQQSPRPDQPTPTYDYRAATPSAAVSFSEEDAKQDPWTDLLAEAQTLGIHDLLSEIADEIAGQNIQKGDDLNQAFSDILQTLRSKRGAEFVLSEEQQNLLRRYLHLFVECPPQ